MDVIDLDLESLVRMKVTVLFKNNASQEVLAFFLC